MDTKHTPLPWTTDGRTLVQEVDGTSYWSGQPYIADCLISQSMREPGNTKANADFICRAVNNHYELLEACKVALAGFNTASNTVWAKSYKKTLREAIARAEGTQQ